MTEATKNVIEEIIENGSNKLLELMAKRAEEKLLLGVTNFEDKFTVTEDAKEQELETQVVAEEPPVEKPKRKRRSKAEIEAKKAKKAKLTELPEPTEVETEPNVADEIEEFNKDVTEVPTAPKPEIVESEPVYTYDELNSAGWTDEQIVEEYPNIAIPSVEVPSAPKKPKAPKAPAKPEMPR